MILSRILATFALAGLASATGDKECYSACKVVEAAISNLSDVYYPGKYEQLRQWSGEFIYS